ncbi:3-isopropylmalate dehydratase small subunit [Ponticaulis sp.]|uniref:3-isopropylmalate dehydratase small subunit n=1 Tax=Ponticaulis sp. TaxID=2020902 RepID=UPI000B6C9E99|nr:3-isopropylmalate dehydratase small subunit [Ponticaulis sp.]MAJ09606.1 3-isopropylmalate dehydratase small subunit [Ponticaulis sp.]RPG18945.1 MAG: 3-isopropylmalate dehydratase small subunit [Hyphomonadaceae bacterium TMED125]HBH89415.1 3-isopropylmalate dehydratase small subunit [Hyphomonadaceae bacterium]HBJ93703.1 3-isopropylmalate dehydratase small subunit [Hyphomonadaceae bacterium]|tara:strand:+ start:3522 stop:4127 length:606 start_codon:yes stop_codon:yes gene_type:complete
MKPLKTVRSLAVPLIVDNIDTDIIIPSREMKSVSKTGLSDGLFAGWRYTAVGSREINPDFVLNDAKYADAEILLSGDNMGCGSSREHAAWALAEYGFRVVIARSFNPIFRGNCIRNGILPVKLSPEPIAKAEGPITVNLEAMTITAEAGDSWSFELETEAREMLLEGLDPIDLTLKRAADIAAFREADRARRPWIYNLKAG